MDKQPPPQAPLPFPVLTIKQAICFSCWNPSETLNRCGACKRVSYCSQDCQKEHWKGHKRACKPILGASNLRKPPTAREGRTWETYRAEKLNDVKHFRAENPNYAENDHRFIMFEPYCRSCYRSISQLQGRETLKTCTGCHLASFCSACPQSHESAECTKYQEVETDEKFLMQHFRKSGQTNVIFCTEKPRVDYVSLSAADDWYDYFTKVSDKDMISDMITRDWKPKPDAPPMAKNMGELMRLAANTLTIPLTIIAGLEKIYPDINAQTELKIHLIGASIRELEALMVFEELLHLLPSLKKLDVTYTGPDVPKTAATKVGTTKPMDCCPDCTSASRTRSLGVWNGLYHDYVKEKGYISPDLAVAFHTGSSQDEQDSWLPTLEHLATAKHPTLFTTYNEREMKEETAILKKSGASYLVEGEINKWKGPCPLLEVMEEEEAAVYYVNNYWYITTGKKS